MNESLNQYFELHGRDAILPNRRVRVIYEDRNIQKRIIVRKEDAGLFHALDTFKIDTSRYEVIDRVPHQHPEVAAFSVRLKFF